ncbi:hypothetical protein L1987_54047 [Smallanthus sonchifolius]|uniref:Uncharacterized protein n=1 Tax=Smallanthus sonchifolius TaxID=185202 RepID=A0ACB9E658_9ASTR|nr:hypothetical protein L1987_54047 [Smallanthus sonchifolius]
MFSKQCRKEARGMKLTMDEADRSLSFPFPSLINDFFEITSLSYSQVMPMVWRILFLLDKLNRSHSLTIGIPELASVYNLRTHGHSRFLLQLKKGQIPLVQKATQNDGDWRGKYFFVKRASISGGDLLPL